MVWGCAHDRPSSSRRPIGWRWRLPHPQHWYTRDSLLWGGRAGGGASLALHRAHRTSLTPAYPLAELVIFMGLRYNSQFGPVLSHKTVYFNLGHAMTN